MLYLGRTFEASGLAAPRVIFSFLCSAAWSFIDTIYPLPGFP